jgi:hypothetical protein
MKTKQIHSLPLQEALANLEKVTSIDLNGGERLGIVDGWRLVTGEDGSFPPEAFLIGGESVGGFLDLMEASFTSLHRHLVSLYETGIDLKARKGVEAMVVLSGEAARKGDLYLVEQLGAKGALQGLEGYQNLSYFYHHTLKKEKAEEDCLDVALLKEDQNYELFLIRNSEGMPCLDPGAITRLRLSVDFDVAGGFEEDPFLKVRSMLDRDLQMSASQILASCQVGVRELFAIVKREGHQEFSKSLMSAVIALMLAASSSNLIQNRSGKSCLTYFQDFQHYLRQTLENGSYLEHVAGLGKKGGILMADLASELARALFFHPGGIRQEVLGLIHRTMRKGEKSVLMRGEGGASQLMIDDEHFRSYLAKFPNGPLFKWLDQAREEGPSRFDPLMQGNVPYKIGEWGGVSLLHLPSPTIQEEVGQAKVAPEFSAFLRTLRKKHLLINLQDRTSWQEHARSLALENLAKQAVHGGHLVTITLPVDTDFYHQTGEYAMGGDLIEILREILKTPEESGFFFPKGVEPLFEKAIDKARPFVKERKVFIDIFYLALVELLAKEVHAGSVSFTSKDGVDSGALFSALFAASLSKKGDGEEFRLIGYRPALMVRERAPYQGRVMRALEAFRVLFD